MPTALMATPVGCVAGVVTKAVAGAIIGTVVVCGPALAVSGADLVSTVVVAPGTTKWADEH